MSLLYILLLLPAVSLAINLKPYDETAGILFDDVNSNKDDVITRHELRESFDKYDTNHDDRISHREYTQHVNASTPALLPLSLELYKIYDVDNDHHLDEHDFNNLFALIDSDSNGRVERSEFVRYWTILLKNLEHLHSHDNHNNHNHNHNHNHNN
ncbi:putative uncharacterized protein DDB_G0287457 [Aplysia californica]|uniref:EF-hand domain-containing protein n=1 Tax=Aplysia californica TaxID=6500 RepID=A0ABM0ZW92_APLCA|nr:putative uncharacterized protein DDB_G0287457 [Aplysia californica]